MNGSIGLEYESAHCKLILSRWCVEPWSVGFHPPPSLSRSPLGGSG